MYFGSCQLIFVLCSDNRKTMFNKFILSQININKKMKQNVPPQGKKHHNLYEISIVQIKQYGNKNNHILSKLSTRNLETTKNVTSTSN